MFNCEHNEITRNDCEAQTHRKPWPTTPPIPVSWSSAIQELAPSIPCSTMRPVASKSSGEPPGVSVVRELTKSAASSKFLTSAGAERLVLHQRRRTQNPPSCSWLALPKSHCHSCAVQRQWSAGMYSRLGHRTRASPARVSLPSKNIP